MYALLSPAKALDLTPAPLTVKSQAPAMLSETQILMKTASQLSENDIAELMGLSEKLAKLNFERFQSFSTPFTAQNALPAIFTFNGEVYRGLEARSLNEKELDWAQEHLGMLSGLYGLLRPKDWMQPYRLEMGTRLNNARGKNLYAFWGTLISERLNEIMADHAEDTVVNLASNEYFKAVKVKALKGSVITCVFEDWKTHQDEGKVISFMAKQARGMMARFMIKEQIDRAEGLKDFSAGRYEFRADRSDAQKYVFSRKFISAADAKRQQK